MTIKEYLLGISPMTTDGIVDNVLVKRTVAVDSAYEEVDERTRDLSEADVLMGIVMMPSTVGGREEQVGSWREKVSGSTLTSSDKREMRHRAKALYDKWEEEFPYPCLGGVKLFVGGMQL